MTNATDARFMAAALALGARGLGQTWPNPSVGCVIVKDGRVVGRGQTSKGGRPHAEVQALAMAGKAAAGATAYVTLEPCAHTGKTPPCAEALIAARVARVVTPLMDPDARVAGRGIEMLRAAGIDLAVGALADAARRAHRGFLLSRTEGRPSLTLKLASSFDGRIATATGESRWITGQDARRLVHAERLRHDVVLVGGGTARADDPDLSVRNMGPVSQPVRAVASRHLNLPTDSRLLASIDKGPVWAIADDAKGSIAPETRASWERQGAKILAAPAGPGGQLDPLGILQALGAQGITRVFCEGGGALAASFLQAGLVDELVGFTAGIAIGAEGQPAVGALGLDQLASAPRFRLISAQQVGADVVHRWERSGS